MQPTLRQIRYLVALADHGGFTRGAVAMGVTQPSFSQQIQLIEKHLGGRVVERGGKSILTPLGRDAVGAARRVLAEADAFAALADRRDDALVGTIRLGVSPTLGPYLLPQLVARLHSTSPTLRAVDQHFDQLARQAFADMDAQGRARRMQPRKLIEMLIDGAHDVVLMQLPVDDARLHIERLFREPLYVAMATDDPLRTRDELVAADLAGRGLLTLLPQYRLSEQILALAERAGAHVLRDYEGTSLSAIRQMAGMGMGLALLPELYVRQEIRDGGDVIVRAFAGGREYREIGLIWRTGAGRATAFHTVADLLRAVAG